MKYYSIILSLCVLLACSKNTEEAMINRPQQNENAITYLALGDSYTIGEAVPQQESFPYQLANLLKSQGLPTNNPKIVAKTGWTTGELQNAIKAENLTQKYDMVTLLIGVNNQYRGYAETAYRLEFIKLLKTAINFAGGNKNHVFVVSIPDWGVTPFGKNSGKSSATIAQEIDAFNKINKEETLAMGVGYTDITPDSRNASTDVGLVANDGLHPSGKMYGEWAANIAGAVVKAFK